MSIQFGTMFVLQNKKRTMKIRILGVVLFWIGSFSWAVAQNNTLPDVNIKNIDGDAVNIADFGKSGKVTVLNFWATWCTPCKKELNNIAELYPDWQEEYDVEILAVSIDDSRNTAKVKTYVNGQSWDYTVLLDQNQDLQRALNFQSIPYTIMLNKEGKIVYRHNGYVEGDEYELEEKIKEYSN